MESVSSNQHFCLRWNNHLSNMLELFDELMEKEAFTDAYIACDNGDIIKCHKLVLAACSPYFANILNSAPEQSPLIHVTTVRSNHMRHLVDYMYRGEVNVAQEELQYLLDAGSFLQIKGLSDDKFMERDLSRTPSKHQQHHQQQQQQQHQHSRGVYDNSARSPNPDISTSTMSHVDGGGSEGGNGHTSPPHSTSSPYAYPYVKPSTINRPSVHHNEPRQSTPAWNLPYPGHHLAHLHSRVSQMSIDQAEFFAAQLKNLNNQDKDFANFMQRDTPILRTCLGQGHADSSQEGIIPAVHDYRSASNGSAHEEMDLRRNSMDISPAQSPYHQTMDGGSKKLSPKPYGANKPQQKPDWKRYKQYSKEDIELAINAVKGGMSALQAARKYKVPSRTLYDKVKKQGICRPPRNRGSGGGCSISSVSDATFPIGVGGNKNGEIYSAMSNRNLDNSSRAAIEEAASILQSAFNKSRENSTDDEMKLEIRETSPSPPPSHHGNYLQRSQQQQQQQQQHDDDDDDDIDDDGDNMVEDLSMNRKTDTIISPTVKEENSDVPENYSRK